MGESEIPDAIRRIGGSPRMRKGAFWVVVLVGGGLQYARTNTKHPSTVLIVWTWIYTTALVVLIVGLIVYSVIAVRERFRRR
jgi:heme/copper-type cytochrome/quinol oxidase subunit 2